MDEKVKQWIKEQFEESEQRIIEIDQEIVSLQQKINDLIQEKLSRHGGQVELKQLAEKFPDFDPFPKKEEDEK